MACKLVQDENGDWSAPASTITIGIIPKTKNTKLSSVHYNNVNRTVDNDKTSTFDIVKGAASVVLVMTNPGVEEVEIVEVCGGNTQHIMTLQPPDVTEYNFEVKGL